MSDERRKVLDMLAEGKLSVDEAERLLKAINGRSDLESRVQDAIEGRLRSLDRLGENLSAEIREGIRERVTVVLDEEGQASTHDDAFEVGNSPRLDVRSFNGPVRVAAGEPGTIRVQAKLKDPQAVKYSAVQQGDTIMVEATPRGRPGGFLSGLLGQQCGAGVEVTVPAATSVDLVTSNGPIELRGTASGGTVKTSNSRIQVEQFKGDLKAQTSNGRIAVETLEGSAKLTTSNGRVSIHDGRGQFEVSTSNGRIELQGSMEPGGCNRLTTVNGRIDVMLDGEPSLKLSASTVNGRANCEIPSFVASVEDHQQGSRRRGRRAWTLEGTAGAGEAELVAKTVNGTIMVR